MRTSKGTRYTQEHTRSMAGRKRSSDGPAAAAKITKYFCSEAVSTGSGVSEGGSQTESDVSLESEFTATASSSASSSGASNAASRESVSMNDLGHIIKSAMDVADVCHAVCELSNGQKYQLLNDHYKPSADYSFPKTFCYRSFQHRWLEKHPWLVYSKAAKGGFCKFCALFSKNRANLGVLVNKPFTNWIKVHKIVQGHESNSYHYHAVQEGLDFQRSIEQPETNIDVRMSTELFQRIQENRNVVLSVYFTVGDNVLPLEEMLKRSICLVTLVTFLAILKLLATHAPVLKAHLETEILPIYLLIFKMK